MASADPTAETYAVFVGLDLTYGDENLSARVVDVRRDSVELLAGDIPFFVAKSADGELRGRRLPTVSGTQVSISNLAGSLAFGAENDPVRAAIIEQSRLAAYQTDRELATHHELLLAQTQVPGDHPGGLSLEGIKADTEAAKENYMDATGSASRDRIFNAGDRVHKSRTGSDGVGHDAFSVSFQLASEEVIDDAYAVLLVVLRGPQSPSVRLTALELAPLPRISEQPRTVTITREGLPSGFAVERYEVHVYHRGCEFVSNLSEKSTLLTRRDAHQFLVFEHVLENPKGVVPAAPLLELVSAGRASVPSDQFDRLAVVTVDERGRVADFTWGDRTEKPELPGMAEFVRSVCFLPQVEDGTPVKATILLPLRALIR